MIRFAVIGFGFMGSTHAAQILQHPDAELVALVEQDKSKVQKQTVGNIASQRNSDAILNLPVFATLEEMLQEVQVDCVSICLPTHLHREITVRALQAGLHVICEKPMALTVKDCDAMIEAARKSQRFLFIAHCIRFWPEYEILKRYVESDELGVLNSILFRRVSPPPFWTGSQTWFTDPKQSGGCVFDLHVHDVDFLQYTLGRPKAVFSRGLFGKNGANNAVVTQYLFDRPLICVAEGSWVYAQSFKMTYSAVFEHGQLEYDSSRTNTLILTRKGQEKSEPLIPSDGDGYSRQYDYFINCIGQERPPVRITPESARLSIECAVAELTSMQEIRIITI